jgi:Glyoxalase-like domain
MKVQLDHLVVAAKDLQQGVAYIKEELGVSMPYGGLHPKMGTHNHLIQLGNRSFLEVIAINPDLPKPLSPRWFGLDDPLILASLTESPRLVSWVVNCDDIYNVIQNAACSFGKPELINRGELSWHFGLPSDGRLLAGGLLPYLIQWHGEDHPSEKMVDVGVELVSLEIYHQYPDWLENILNSINANKLVTVSRIPSHGNSSIKAVFSTPKGPKELRSW